MELMDENLTIFLKSSPKDFPYHIVVNLSQEIAQALAFLHANGIIHRDLSSNNVLLIAGVRAKVSDFGMSKFADMSGSQSTLTLCPGTLAFMSPEALDEPPLYTEKLDNFSFGVILIQLITRQFPAPSDRYKTMLVLSPTDSTQPFKSKVSVPEVERREAHIRLIEPDHPLLPIALECLKDEAEERPSSQQLCQSLDALKTYEKSQLQDVIQSLRNEVQEKNQQIKTKNQTVEEIESELEAKERQLQDKDEVIKMKDKVVLATDQEAQSLQNEVETMEHEFRNLRQQLESPGEASFISGTPFQAALQIALHQYLL